jgi:sulfatase modifying factor 1
MEWVADWLDEGYYKRSPDRSPGGPQDGSQRVVRGGAWLTFSEMQRTTFRGNFTLDTRTDYVGLRCAKDATP